eukprot:g17125.t1
MGAAIALAPCQELETKRARTRRGAAEPGPLNCVQSAREAARALLYGREPEAPKKAFVHPISERIKRSEVGDVKDDEDEDDDGRRTTESFFHALRTADFRKVVDLVEEGTDLTKRTLRGQETSFDGRCGRCGDSEDLAWEQVGGRCRLVEPGDVVSLTSEQIQEAMHQKEASRFLLQTKALVNSQDVMGRTPLMLSCMEGSERIVALLIEAGAGSESEVVKYLLRKHASPQASTQEGVSSLMVACVRGNTMAAKQLIRRRCEVNQVEQSGNSALMLALAAAQQDLVAWLLQEDVEVDLSNEMGETACEIAAQQGFNSLKSTILMISRRREEQRRKEQLWLAAQALDEDAG